MAFSSEAGSGLRARREPWRGLRAVGAPRPEPDNVRKAVSPCPELDCIRHLVSPGLLAAAERRAMRIRVGADRVLIAAGTIKEEEYFRALAAWLGLACIDLDSVPRDLCPLTDAGLLQAASAGQLPLHTPQGLSLVVVPRGGDARRLIAHLRSKPELRSRVVLASGQSLTRFVTRHAGRGWSRNAANSLRDLRPDLSAATANRWARRWTVVSCVQFLALAALVDGTATAILVSILLSGAFFAWTALRILSVFSARNPPPRASLPLDDEVPVYTILVALHDEARAVPGLLKALGLFDYPKEKLDIKFILEPEDRATRAAIERLAHTLPFEIVTAPRDGPRTKPKALNAALPFARGQFLAVYDAEDRPDPAQLKLALTAFRAAGDELACVQASLTIDNTQDSWLTRLFTAEYAGLFDVFLPGLASHRLPLPLGGSSNHFRTAALRRVGAWDPYNVTEDADLGMRLARFGYCTDVIASTTYEEAPSTLMPWLRQRTRWFKGWMQTWLVHMRKPAELFSQLGLAGFCTFHLVVGGTVLASLVHPVFLVLLAFGLSSEQLLPVRDGVMAAALAGLYGGTLLGGYFVSVVLGVMGLARRRLLGSAWVMLLIPLHWLLLSLASWRALVQLVRDPYRWEKTEHGLAQTSRLGAINPSSTRPRVSRKSR